jgi:diguanylate cyclase (GGDEF)-like protein
MPAWWPVGKWSLWTQPPALIAYALLLVGLVAIGVVGGVASGVASGRFRSGDLLLWAALATCGAVCVEINRRADEPAGVAKDLLSAWTIPVVLLLPPVYALLTPIPFTLVKQLRGRSGLVYRRTVSAAAIGVADATGSLLFHHLAPAHLVAVDAFRTRPFVVVPAAIAAAAVCVVLNAVLIATAARLSSPGARWRDLLGSRESHGIDVAETCAGVLVAMACSLTSLAAVLAVPFVLLLHRTQSHAQLRTAARVDAKTGLLNAAAWQEEADREIVRATRERRPLAVLLADLDNFKAINDRHGHLVGDRMLVLVAGAMQAGLRSYDHLGRFGGEEFTVLLPNADHAEASLIAERLRQEVAAAQIQLDGTVLQVTVSIGGAVLGTHGADLTDLLTAADAALYHAKNAGRDAVFFRSV